MILIVVVRYRPNVAPPQDQHIMPARANASAVARPIPVPPPQTTA
jgi:hypothetical protein